MGPTLACRPQVGPMLAPLTLLSGPLFGCYLLSSCTFDGAACPNDSIVTEATDFGSCVTFNGRKDTPFQSTKSGKKILATQKSNSHIRQIRRKTLIWKMAPESKAVQITLKMLNIVNLDKIVPYWGYSWCKFCVWIEIIALCMYPISLDKCYLGILGARSSFTALLEYWRWALAKCLSFY